MLVVVPLLIGCAGNARQLTVRASAQSQGVLPDVSCVIPTDRRSPHGLRLLDVQVGTPCTTKKKVLVVAFDDQKTIVHEVFDRTINASKPELFESELADIPDAGTDVTVVVWTRCLDGEPQQGVDTCKIPR